MLRISSHPLSTSHPVDMQSVDISDPDAWDDSVLIRAFSTATSTHTLHHQRSSPTLKRPNKSRRTSHCAPPPAPNCSTPSSLPIAVSTEPNIPPVRDIATARIPPPPPALFDGSVSLDIEKLLIAWYEAGYRAGKLAALNPDPSRKAT